MDKRLSIGTMMVALVAMLAACGGNQSTSTPVKESSQPKVSSSKPTTSKAPTKKVTDLEISLGNSGDKAYITVRGTQQNFAAGELTWAWGLKNRNTGEFTYGKDTPTDAELQPLEFDGSNQFTVKLCLTDIDVIVPGVLYDIYGGPKEYYNYIPFATNMFGASDATRTYYLRQDQDNSLTFDSVQPMTYTKASVVELAQTDLPDGVTQDGAYIKFGGANSKNLTMETINSWHEAGHIAGDWQRVIGGGYDLHVHADTERFWKIEGDDVFFYLYIGFVAPGEGWMLHFDLVTGNQNAGLHFDGTDPEGQPAYTIAGENYRIYGNRNKSGEENYWGCLGIYKDPIAVE